MKPGPALETDKGQTFSKAAIVLQGGKGQAGVSAAEPAGAEGIAVNHRYSAEGKVGDNLADSDDPSPW